MPQFASESDKIGKKIKYPGLAQVNRITVQRQSEGA